MDAGRHLAKVSIQPEGVLSGWLPVLGMGTGNGWGLICPPAVGAQVVVIPLDGDHENLAVLPGAWSTVNLPPNPPVLPGGAVAAVAPGEIGVVSESGAYIRLSADGTIAITTPGNAVVNAGGNATITAAGSISLSAPTVTGGDGTFLDLCTSEVWAYLQTHTHADPQGSSTGTPQQPWPAAPLTTNFKAS